MASENHIFKLSNAGGFKTITRYPDMLAGNTVWNPWEPQGAYDALATITVGATAVASIDFVGIPTGYKHLEIRALSRDNRAVAGNDLCVRFNGDSSASYRAHSLYGDGAAAYGYATGATSFIVGGVSSSASAATNIFAANTISILDYASTTKNKTLRNLCGVDFNGSGFMYLDSGFFFGNTNAITSITLFPAGSASFVQYSQYALYGVR